MSKFKPVVSTVVDEEGIDYERDPNDHCAVVIPSTHSQIEALEENTASTNNKYVAVRGEECYLAPAIYPTQMTYDPATSKLTLTLNTGSEVTVILQ